MCLSFSLCQWHQWFIFVYWIRCSNLRHYYQYQLAPFLILEQWISISHLVILKVPASPHQLLARGMCREIKSRVQLERSISSGGEGKKIHLESHNMQRLKVQLNLSKHGCYVSKPPTKSTYSLNNLCSQVQLCVDTAACSSEQLSVWLVYITLIQIMLMLQEKNWLTALFIYSLTLQVTAYLRQWHAASSTLTRLLN